MNKTNKQYRLMAVLALATVAWLWSPTASAQAVPEPASDKWSYLVAPYLWATAIQDRTYTPPIQYTLKG